MEVLTIHSFFLKPDQGAINTQFQAEIDALHLQQVTNSTAIKTVTGDYVTSKNVGSKFRNAAPVYHTTSEDKVDYNELSFDNHLIFDYATGETNAPPVPERQWMYVEVIKTYQGGSINVLQRAWGYQRAFLATRTRFQGVWSPWTEQQAVVPAGGFPPIPDQIEQI